MKRAMLIIRAIVLLLSLIVAIKSSAQSYSWAVNKKFSLSCYGYRTSLSPIDNSICVSGNFIGPYSQPDSNDMGGFVMKYDASGSLQWQKIFYSAAAALRTINAIDSQGNVFVSGSFSGNMQFDNNMFNGGGMFLLKYAPDGTLLFSYHEPRARANTICIDQNNNIYLAGTFNTDLDTIFHGQPFHKDLFIAKYDQNGNFLWVKGFFCFEYTEKAFDLCLDAQGNIYTTGIFGVENPYFTDSIQLISTGGYDGYVAKYNSNAELQWVKTINGAGMEVSKSISVSLTGDIFIGGYYDNYIGSSTTFFDSIPILKGGSGNNAADVFIAKYDASGNCQWVRTAGGNGNDFVKGVYVDNNGDAFITGYFGSYGDSAVFGNQTFYCPHGQIAMFLAQYDTNGNLKSVEASQGGQGQAHDLIGNAQGDVYVTGGFLGNWNFGTLSLVGDEEMFLIKLNYEALVTSSNNIKKKEKHLLICPNPTGSIFQINYSSTEKSNLIRLSSNINSI